ncbi:MAG TPA: LexA family transcriptional regulator [Candidatus Anaerofilum excrementigallinarum]|nr:LexA family transcriptional regulator [Candidatus Anaerofilum excrementigallinarum]
MFKQRLKELRNQRGYTQVGLSRALGVSQQAVGKWETGRCTPDPQMLTRLAATLDTTVDYLLGGGNVLAECMVPVLGTVKAGFGALAFEEDYGSEPANVKDPSQYFYLIVRGDSMEPRIHDGDLALVRRQPTLESGELGVVVYGEGEGTLKKYIRQGQAVILQPFNPAYKSQVIAGADLEQLHIAGRVVETKTKW